MSNDVRVRTETPMLGLHWGEEITLARTPLVDAAIAEGRLTVLDADGDEQPLKGDTLDQALKAAGLSTSGSAAAKRTRLEEHRAAEAAEAAGPGAEELAGDPGPSAVTPATGPARLPATPPTPA